MEEGSLGLAGEVPQGEAGARPWNRKVMKCSETSFVWLMASSETDNDLETVIGVYFCTYFLKYNYVKKKKSTFRVLLFLIKQKAFVLYK